MNNLSQIYNSRILNLFSEYVRKQHPEVNLTSVYKHAGITKYEIEDPGHWFNQGQIDRYHDMMVRLTGNKMIARDAGRHIVTANAMGAVKQYTLGLLNISSSYMLMGKLYPMISCGADIQTRKIGRNRIEILSTPKENVDEKPYQCLNRIGIFESLAKLFTDKFATVEHSKCFHKGDSYCRYIISWEEPSFRSMKRMRNLAAVLGVVASIILFFLISPVPWAISTLVFAILALIFFCISATLEKNELSKTIEVQGNAAGAHIREINYRYNNAMLVQEIGQAASSILDKKELVKIVMSKMEKRLDFDRGMVMLVNRSQTRLEYITGFGYNLAVENLLKQTRFHLDKPSSTGVFINAFKSQKPILVNNIREIENSLSERSRQFADKIGAHAIICIPIVYKKQSLGILAVDNINSKRPLTKSDMSLLQGVTAQTAAGLANAASFKKLKLSEKQYKSLYESAPNAYFLVSVPSGTILDCNPAALRLMAINKEVLTGSNVFDYTLNNMTGKNQIMDVYQAFGKGKTIHDIELQLKRPDGNLLWGSLSVEPFMDTSGNVTEARAIVVDITERKRLEVQLRNAQKMEAIGTLAGGVAHDLNNILSGLVSYPELILLDLEPESPIKKPLMRIQESGERAAAVVQDLLTLARRNVPVMEPVSLGKMVRDYLKSPEFERLISFHPDVNVRADIPDMLPILSGSPIHLAKTVMNLVSNAVEAMPDGGTVTIRLKKQHIQRQSKLSRYITGNHIVMTVEDSGIGIARDDIHSIFEPFFTKKEMGRSGTGLGMAVVWGTVKDHGGHIKVKSKIGKGTLFTLYFPASGDPVKISAKRKSIRQFRGKGESILVVDDVPEQMKLASDILNRLGYNVSIVSSGEAAVEYVKVNKPDLLVLDMIMDPGIDGLETYRRIKTIRPEQKAVIASGYSESTKVKKAQDMGAGAYVKKPYVMEQIGIAVRRELDK